MIGSVGGALGMCIGFSFTNIITYVINFMQHVIYIMKTKSKTQRLLKSKLKSNRSLDEIKIDTCKEQKLQHENCLKWKQYFDEEKSKLEANLLNILEKELTEIKVEIQKMEKRNNPCV